MLLFGFGLSALLFLLGLWRAARRIDPDDETTLFGVSKVGLLCKLAFVFGWRLPQFSSKRFLLFPSGSATPISAGDMVAYLLARGAPKGTLIVAFSGGAVNKVGVPRRELRRTISSCPNASKCDQCYVNDPSGMSFYSHELGAFSETLRGLCTRYAHCVFVGNCMGATAVLRFAELMPSAASTALAFNPEVDPARDMRRPFFVLAALLQPLTTWRLRSELHQSARKAVGRVQVHSSTWPPESAQARRLGCDLELRGVVSSEAACCSALDEVDTCERLMGRCIIARLVHADCSTHGLLAKVMRPKGGLAAVLERAVSRTRMDMGYATSGGGTASLCESHEKGTARRSRALD